MVPSTTRKYDWYSQRYGAEYHQTFAIVAGLEIVRLLAAFVAELNLKILQIDNTISYLNGSLEKDI